MFEMITLEEDDMVVLNNFKLENHENNHHEKMRQKIKARKIQRNVELLLNENKKLKHHNNLLMNICKLRHDDYILKSTVSIQSHVRGWILRCDKKEFENSVSLFLRACRVFLAKKRSLKLKKNIVKIQATARGFFQRNTPLGKAIKNMLELKREIFEYELGLLMRSRFKKKNYEES